MNLMEEFDKAGTFDGLYYFSGGEVGYSSGYWDGHTFRLRYESGWYCPYKNDGTRIAAGIIRSPDGSEKLVQGKDNRNIVKFEAVAWKDGMQYGFSP